MSLGVPFLLLFAFLPFFAFFPGHAAAEQPDPACSSCSLDATGRLLLVPDDQGNPHARFSLVIRSFSHPCVPIGHAVVEILVGGQPGGQTHLCEDAEQIKYSDESGFVEFEIHGGGCMRGLGACVIRANGVVLRDYRLVASPDYSGWDNAGEPNRWSLSVTPVDLAAFIQAFQGGIGGSSCHDYDNNGRTDASDLAVFAAAYKGGSSSCAR